MSWVLSGIKGGDGAVSVEEAFFSMQVTALVAGVGISMIVSGTCCGMLSIASDDGDGGKGEARSIVVWCLESRESYRFVASNDATPTERYLAVNLEYDAQVYVAEDLVYHFCVYSYEEATNVFNHREKIPRPS